MPAKIYPNVSSSLNPASIPNVDGYESCKGLCQGSMNALEFASDFLERAHEARGMLKGNRLVSADEAIIQLDAKNSKKLTQAHNQFYACRTELERNVESFQNELTKPLDQQANANLLSTEIRSHFKSLTTEDRRLQISEAINSGDTKTATAVLGAPPYLSGLDQSQQKNYTLSFHKKNSPELDGKLNTMKKVLKIMEHRHSLLQIEFDKAIGAEPKKVKFLREQKVQAEAALRHAQ